MSIFISLTWEASSLAASCRPDRSLENVAARLDDIDPNPDVNPERGRSNRLGFCESLNLDSVFGHRLPVDDVLQLLQRRARHAQHGGLEFPLLKSTWVVSQLRWPDRH